MALATPALAQTEARGSPASPGQVPPAPESGGPVAAPAEGPIVSDQQFQSQLPSLNPDINAPLEPIQSFQGPTPPAPPPPAGVAPPAGAEPPPLDPALNEPLPPLSSFDATPLETPAEDNAAAGKTTPEAEEKAQPIRYTLTVQGLKEVELEGRFRDLSALEDADGKATNGAMVAARAKEDELLAIRLMRSEGYYDGTATSSLLQVPDQPGQLQVTISATPGQRYAFGAIAIAGPETEPPGMARDALKLESGRPIVAPEVEAAEANVRLKLPQNGYPFAEIGLRDILLDPATHLGDYTLPVDPGPRSRFAGFTTEGRLAFDANHVGILSRFKRGDLYDSRKVDDLREAMVATGLFRTVSAEPVRTGEKAEDGTEYVNILVRQDKGPSRSLNATAGYSTGEGLRLEGTWENRNMFPPEGGLRVTAVGGTQEQSLRVAFTRMNAGMRDRTFLVEAQAARQDFPAYKGYIARIRGQVSRESTPIWQKKWTWAYGGELIASNENDKNFPPISLKNAYFLAAINGQLGYDASNSLLDPTKGFRITGRTAPEVSLREPTKPYIRNIVDGSYYFPAGDSLTLAARARVGSIYGAELDELAPSRRIYGGGGGSVRGYGYQELGPKDADGRPTGGRSQVEFALEARYRFGNYGIVPFIDAGQVYRSQLPKFSDIRYGVGIGGRLYTNFGPLRADVAMPLGRRKGESKFAVYVSIGQAF
jgi:translocation and assembly module TamA